MAHLKVLSPVCTQLTDMLGPLPSEKELLAIPLREELWTDAVTRAVLRNSLEEGIRTRYSQILVLPPSLLDQITEDVLTIAKHEPCGIRGCVLTVVLSSEATETGIEERLVQVKAHFSTPTTHELYVTLRTDQTSWYTKMAKIFRSLNRRKVVISPKYELRKNKICSF